MDVVSYVKTLDLNELHGFIEEMSESSCYLSMLKGFATEHMFKNAIERRGWLCEKIKDKQQKYRYDFDLFTANGFHRIEVKLLDEDGCANANFRDTRPVRLPTGKMWYTTARRCTENFDYLALYNGSEFVITPFDVLKPLRAKNLPATKKREAVILTDEERDWIQCNYVDGRIKLSKIATQKGLSDL